VRGEVESRIRDQLERLLAGMDLVSREEFEAVKAMAAKAREEQELLQRRLDALEGRTPPPPSVPAAPRRASKRKTLGPSGA
jgi:BMFP domain-containing protein YqiC